jgi:ArsR family transcriptional regulator
VTEQVDTKLSGAQLVRLLSALSSPHRLRILATLAGGSVHVSQLAREVQLSRPLVHMHLRRLEAAGLVSGRLELSNDGKALRFYEVTPFAIHLTPDLVVEAARTLDDESELQTSSEKEEKQ